MAHQNQQTGYSTALHGRERYTFQNQDLKRMGRGWVKVLSVHCGRMLGTGPGLAWGSGFVVVGKQGLTAFIDADAVSSCKVSFDQRE